jgi:hypothetical protein
MFLSAYRFTGDPAELVPAYDRMMQGFDAATLDLHVCSVGPTGIVVLDACPSEAVHESFSVSPEFQGAYRQAGLPEPTIEKLGDVHEALLRQPVRP